jgi:ABC-type ATPase with predicted acetyltransferase domain
MMESKAEFWIMDEFAATLDRDTAKIVAFNVQKLARQEVKAVLAATTHTDLFEDLKPSVHVHKRFGKETEVKYYPNETNKECSLVTEMRVVEGSRQDYYQLAGFYYRSQSRRRPQDLFSQTRRRTLRSSRLPYPPAACFGRRVVLPRMSMRELNEKLSIISRVVVHPKYRTIGLGHKLVREILERAGRLMSRLWQS